MIGGALSRYEITALLGKGGRGKVYRAGQVVGALVGTPGWVAPEQFEGREGDDRAGMFALV